ncbi:MAG TPA: class I SAM-dependent methyltransferase [Stellaceae bacterium]|nr:class I SAM-dependent methyltransferase [Stellaceae bacterium]
MRQAIPWPAKIAAKLVLSRLPVGYGLWKRIGLFEHGHMDDPAYGEAVFLRHFRRTHLAGKPGFTCLELGPGDSLFSAVLAKAHGASACWLIDTGAFAARDMAGYRRLARHLQAQNLPAPPEAGLASLDALLAYCGARYLTDGLASLRTVPAASIDFLWSQAVLEHIRKREFDALLRETRRVLRPDGIASHRIDLRDHLAGALNNLRFSEQLWESEWMARSGFYTNRLGYEEMLERFRAAGFAVEIVGVERWPDLPTARRSLAAPFRDRPEESLLVSGFDVVLRPA